MTEGCVGCDYRGVGCEKGWDQHLVKRQLALQKIGVWLVADCVEEAACFHVPEFPCDKNTQLTELGLEGKRGEPQVCNTEDRCSGWY